MEVQDRLNQMLLEKLHQEYEDFLEFLKAQDKEDQEEMFHALFLYQEIISFFENIEVSSQEAVELLDRDMLLDDFYNDWLESFDENCSKLFFTFLENEIALYGLPRPYEEE